MPSAIAGPVALERQQPVRLADGGHVAGAGPGVDGAKRLRSRPGLIPKAAVHVGEPEREPRGEGGFDVSGEIDGNVVRFHLPHIGQVSLPLPR